MQCYEKEKEILTKLGSLVVIAKDASLREIFQSTTSFSEVRKGTQS